MNNAPRLPRKFNRLAWSNLAAQSGEQIALAAAPIVAVLALGAGTGETGLLQTALTLPFLVFAIPAGIMTDRMSRRGLMAGAEAVRAAALIVLLVLIAFDVVTWPLLALLGFIAVCATVVFSVAAPSLVPALVPAQALSIANARIELARTSAFAAGPALGGALVGGPARRRLSALPRRCRLSQRFCCRASRSRRANQAFDAIHSRRSGTAPRSSFVTRCLRRYS